MLRPAKYSGQYEYYGSCFLYYLLKVVLTAVLVVTISEIAKRSTLFAAVLTSIPTMSVFAFIWLYIDTKDVEKVSALSVSIFWLVFPALALFIALPLLLKQGLNFYLSLGLSMGITVACYGLMIFALKYYNIN
ncbi:DUF3147 family protein [Oceanisphaera sp. IT1-181]|uniref:DUF3147 family protein n=1 Tax=Oceanisphaera sp. IT1-181 TaxID=3081199 RepID=UPI0029CA03FD|nr:DUF3147 family protein [Oceanisphaera sp. IT1-181]